MQKCICLPQSNVSYHSFIMNQKFYTSKKTHCVLCHCFSKASVKTQICQLKAKVSLNTVGNTCESIIIKMNLLLYATCFIFHYLKQQYLHLYPYLNQKEIIYLSGKGVQTGWDRIKVSCADSLWGKK